MKRFVILTLCCCLVISFFTMPASASTSGWFDVLDYCTADGATSNHWYFTGTDTVEFDYTDTIGPQRCYYFEIYLTYTADGFTVDDVTCGSGSVSFFDVSFLGDRLVRISGRASGTVQKYWTITFTSEGSTRICFEQFKVYTSRSNTYTLGGQFTATAANGNTLSRLFNGNDVELYPTFNDTSASSVAYNISLDAGWLDYNYISFLMQVNVRSVDSVQARIGDVAIPIDVSYLNGSNLTAQVYYLSSFIDLSSVSKGDIDSTSPLDIVITASAFPAQNYSGAVILTNPVGQVFIEETNSTVTWFQIVERRLDSIRSYLTTINSTISTSVNKVYNFLYTNLGNMLSSINTAINTGIGNVVSKLTSVIGLLQELVDGQNVDDDTMTDIEEGSSELGNISQEMGDLTPEIDVETVTVPLEDIVSADDQVSTNNLMLTIVDNQLITNFLLISVSFALIGFVFFGKR